MRRVANEWRASGERVMCHFRELCCAARLVSVPVPLFLRSAPLRRVRLLAAL